MNKIVIYILSAICAVSAVVALAFTAMQVVIFDEGRFYKSYEENDLYDFIGINEDALKEVTDEMMLYLAGKRDNLVMHADIRGEYQQVFGEREIAHMVDVKKLFMGGFKIRNTAAFLAGSLMIVLFALKRNKAVRPLSISYLWVTGTILILAAVLGIIMLIDFDALFIKFHLMFFDNDLWLLDINTDVLIQMLPESFFNSLALASVAWLSGFVLLPAAAASAYLIVDKKQNG